jgi:amino acid transporter
MAASMNHASKKMSRSGVFALVIVGAIFGAIAWAVVDAFQGDERAKAWIKANHCRVEYFMGGAFNQVPIYRCDDGNLYRPRDIPR